MVGIWAASHMTIEFTVIFLPCRYSPITVDFRTHFILETAAANCRKHEEALIAIDAIHGVNVQKISASLVPSREHNEALRDSPKGAASLECLSHDSLTKWLSRWCHSAQIKRNDEKREWRRSNVRTREMCRTNFAPFSGRSDIHWDIGTVNYESISNQEMNSVFWIMVILVPLKSQSFGDIWGHGVRI